MPDSRASRRVVSHLEWRVVEELEYPLQNQAHTILINLNGDLRTVNPNLRGFIQALKQQPQPNTSDLGNQLIQAFKDIKADQGKERSYMMLTKAEQDEIRMKERLESAKRYIPRLRIEEWWDAAMEEFDYDADKAKAFLEENNIEY